MEESKHMNLYLEALNNLKSGLPKFSLFMFLLVFIWILYPWIMNLGSNVYLEIFDTRIETKNLINILILTYITLIIIFTYREIVLIGSALSKLIVFYSSTPNDDISKLELRIRKFENILSLLLVNLISFIIYHIFKDFLAQLSQTIASLILIFLTLSLLILLFLLSISLSSELEFKISRLTIKKKNGKNGNNKKNS